jgi:uncharacterized membrane protein YraQ (UPF0718 family)
MAGLDGFVTVTLCGLIFLHILPESLEVGGWPALPAALAGLLGIVWLETKTSHRSTGAASIASPSSQAHDHAHDHSHDHTHNHAHGHPHGVSRLGLSLAVLALIIHGSLDGVSLSAGDSGHHHHATDLLIVATILHRLPEGLAIWWFIRPRHGRRAALLALSLAGLATVAGLHFAESMLEHLSLPFLAVARSFLAGVLLHVVLHRHDYHPLAVQPVQQASGLGGVGGLLLLALLSQLEPANPHHSGELEAAQAFVRILAEASPALLLSYLLAGLAGVLTPTGWMDRLSGGSRLVEAVRGALLGLVVPVHSRQVPQTYLELRRRGVGGTAALSFLVVAPELELAAFFLTWKLLGLPFALARVVLGVVLAILLGLLLGGGAELKRPSELRALPHFPPPLPGKRLRQVLHFGLLETVEHSAPWLLLGIGLAAMLEPLVDQGWSQTFSPSTVVPLAALLGLPLYFSASGSTPVAALFLHKGFSVGAVLAFLLTGPAANLGLLRTLSRQHGSAFSAKLGAAMLVCSTGLGLLTLMLFPPGYSGGMVDLHDAPATWLEKASSLAIVLLYVVSLLRRGVRGFLEEVMPGQEAHSAPQCLDPLCADHLQGTGQVSGATQDAGLLRPVVSRPLSPLRRPPSSP